MYMRELSYMINYQETGSLHMRWWRYLRFLAIASRVRLHYSSIFYSKISLFNITTMMNWIWCDYRRNRRHNIRVQWVEMKGKHNGKKSISHFFNHSRWRWWWRKKESLESVSQKWWLIGWKYFAVAFFLANKPLIFLENSNELLFRWSHFVNDKHEPFHYCCLMP